MRAKNGMGLAISFQNSSLTVRRMTVKFKAWFTFNLEKTIIMAVKVAINGFGRIGRSVFRALVEQGMVGKDIEVVAVGDIVPADNLAYLLKYDSIQGRFNGKVESKVSPDAVAKATAAGKKAEDADPDVLVVNGKEIKVVSAKSPADLPWKAMGVELVIESTGLFTDVEKAKGHLPPARKKS